MSTRWVYGFDELDLASERCGGDWDEVRGLLGGKGANLADMTRLGVSVPPDSPSLPRPATHISTKTKRYLMASAISSGPRLVRSSNRLARRSEIRAIPFCFRAAAEPSFPCQG